MKKSFGTLAMAGATVMGGTALPVGAAHAEAACYASEMFPNERIVIDVEKQGVLVTNWMDLVELLFGGKQTAYSAHGKHVYAEDVEPPAEVASNQNHWGVWMAAATGTVDVAVPWWPASTRTAGMQATQSGAHLGLVAQWVRGYGETDGMSAAQAGGHLWALPVTFDCGSEETSATPKMWTCEVYNEFGVYWGNTTYMKVAKMADDERCNLFEALPGVGAPVLSAPASFSQAGYDAEVK